MNETEQQKPAGLSGGLKGRISATASLGPPPPLCATATLTGGLVGKIVTDSVPPGSRLIEQE